MNIYSDIFKQNRDEDIMVMRRGLYKLALELQSQEPIILEYIKSLDNSVRLNVLICLIDGEKEFSTLAKEVPGSKTSLSNHLQLLVSSRLINKLSHGNYELTDTGLLLIESLADFANRISRRQIESPVAYLMTKPKIERIEMKRNEVKQIPEYEASWISLVSTTTGILRSFGEKIDSTDVIGYGGHGFIACMTKGITSPAPPTAHPFFKEIHEGTNSMGFKLHGNYDPGPIFPTTKISMDDQKRLIKLFETIKEQIDKNNPVILWGPITAEFAIVYGYVDDNYLVKTFRSRSGKEETPIHYMDLHSPGGIWYYYFGERTHKMTEEHDREAIIRAHTIASGKNQYDATVGKVEYTEDFSHVRDWDEIDLEFVSGPDAFLVWRLNLEKGKVDSMGNALVAASYQEGYDKASIFLKRISEKYKDRDFHSALVQASAIYANLSSSLKDFCEIFPFPGKGEETRDELDAGMALLSRCQKYTIEAIDVLQSIIDNWELD